MRIPRKHSETSIYHVILRGINRQQIFEEEQDYLKFLLILNEVKIASKYNLYAYCLMGNHIHMLIGVEGEPLEQIMRRIENRFVHWYNLKYERTGHLFENRFLSEPVEDDAYFLNVTRYILQNPVKAGICDSIFDYPWSSAKESCCSANSLVSVDILYSNFSERRGVLEYLIEECDLDDILDINTNTRELAQKNEELKIKDMIQSITGCANLSEFQQIERNQRNKCIIEIVDSKVSIRKLSRITGMSKSQIQRIVQQKL